MPRPSSLSTSLYLLPTLLFSLTANAQMTMQDVQLISGFTRRCISAYETELPSCDIAMFRGIGGASQCTQDCFNELSTLTQIVQSACEGQQAGGDTVIGHFFLGDADQWLCGFETAGVAGSSTTAAAAETTAAQTTEAANTDAGSTTVATTTAAVEENTSSTTTAATTTAATETESEVESTRTGASLTTTTLETSTISTTSETESTTATAVATAAGSSNNDQTGGTGGGSPFDIALPARGVGSSRGASKIGMVSAALLGIVTML